MLRFIKTLESNFTINQYLFLQEIYSILDASELLRFYLIDTFYLKYEVKISNKLLLSDYFILIIGQNCNRKISIYYLSLSLLDNQRITKVYLKRFFA